MQTKTFRRLGVATAVPRGRSRPRGRRSSSATSAAALYEGALLIPGDGSAPDCECRLPRAGRRDRARRAAWSSDAPAGAVRIDLSGKTVMPALINTHGHPGFQMG